MRTLKEFRAEYDHNVALLSVLEQSDDFCITFRKDGEWVRLLADSEETRALAIVTVTERLARLTQVAGLIDGNPILANLIRE